MTNNRAWIDPISNIIRPRSFNVRAHIGKLIIGPWPPGMIQPFIHELTHHWCFDSNVGACLALQKIRAYKTAFRESRSDSENYRIIEDMTAGDALLRLYTPLAEGLALFAEYDTNIGQSSIISSSLSWLSLALSGHPVLDLTKEADIAAFREALLKVRLSPMSLNRKMEFLSPSLWSKDDPEKESYYTGYLIIKRLYWDLAQKYEIFSDKDFFLSFIRSWFYEDLVMVELLLKKYDHPGARFVAMIEHYGSRIMQLYENDLPAELATYEMTNNQPPGHRNDFYIRGIGIREEDSGRGAILLQELLDNINEIKESDSLQLKQVDQVLRSMIFRRKIIDVTSEPVLVQVRNGRVSFWPYPQDDGIFVASMGALEGTPDTDGKELGWKCFILIGGANPYAGIIIGIGNTVVHVHQPNPELDYSDRVNFIKDFMTDPAANEALYTCSAEWTRAWFDQAPPPLRELIDAYSKSISNHAERVRKFFFDKYLQNGQAGNPLSGPRKMQELFAGNGTLYKAFIILGILSDQDTLSSDWQEYLKEKGFDMKTILEFAVELENVYDVQLVYNDQGRFVWLI